MRHPDPKGKPPCFTSREWDAWCKANELVGGWTKGQAQSACADCTHQFQQQMIRQKRCVNPIKVLPRVAPASVAAE